MYATYFKPFPTLTTPRLILRKVQKKDLDDIYEYCRLPSSYKYAQWQPHEDRGVTKQYLAWLFSAMRHGAYFTWVIELRETGRVIGTCSFVNMDEEYKIAEIGYGIGKRFWGNGYATEAVRAVMDYGFTRVGLLKVNARIMRENLSSVRLAGRVGMSCEGIQRKGVYAKKQAHDLYLFGITDEDYKQLLAEEEKTDRAKNAAGPDDAAAKAKSVEAAESTKTAEKAKTAENVATAENIETAENAENAATVETAQSAESVEEVATVEDDGNAEKSDEVKTTEKAEITERVAEAESIKNTENAKSDESAPAAENTETVQSTAAKETIEAARNAGIAENGEAAGNTKTAKKC